MAELAVKSAYAACSDGMAFRCRLNAFACIIRVFTVQLRGSQTSRVTKTRIRYVKPKALVIFSGGQDSTTCLIQAIQTYGRENVQAITFRYGQRHAVELERAEWIAQDLGVSQTVLDLSLMRQITHNALMDETAAIETADNGVPNTFVDGRNALFLLYAAILPKGRVSGTSSRACAKPIFGLSRLPRRVRQIHERYP